MKTNFLEKAIKNNDSVTKQFRLGFFYICNVMLYLKDLPDSEIKYGNIWLTRNKQWSYHHIHRGHPGPSLLKSKLIIEVSLLWLCLWWKIILKYLVNLLELNHNVLMLAFLSLQIFRGLQSFLYTRSSLYMLCLSVDDMEAADDLLHTWMDIHYKARRWRQPSQCCYL